jgi:3-hydroxyacyl-[acyl-carrier-protein] dehydratase
MSRVPDAPPADPLTHALGLLPHGPEFRFVDRLIHLSPGISGIGEYLVRGDEPFLKGHFPGKAIFPGVLLVEAGAQLAGVVAQSDPQIPPLDGLKLTALRAVKILGTAEPGQAIRLEARVSGRLGKLVQAETSATVDGKTLMVSQVTLSGE